MKIFCSSQDILVFLLSLLIFFQNFFDQRSGLEKFIDGINLFAPTPLRDKIAVEKVPHQKAVVALRFKQISRYFAEGLGHWNEQSSSRELHLLLGIFPFDAVEAVTLVRPLLPFEFCHLERFDRQRDRLC